MAVFLCVLSLIAVLAVEWYLRALLVTPLPKCVSTVFFLDADSEQELEFAIRGYRFLKKYDYLQGDFVIVPTAPTVEGRKAAQIFARDDDIVIIETNEDFNVPEEVLIHGTGAFAAAGNRLRGGISK